MKHVTENRNDVFLDGTGWEGGDEWIRAQFGSYLHALLAATVQSGKFWNILICKFKQILNTYRFPWLISLSVAIQKVEWISYCENDFLETKLIGHNYEWHSVSLVWDLIFQCSVQIHVNCPCNLMFIFWLHWINLDLVMVKTSGEE